MASGARAGTGAMLAVLALFLSGCGSAPVVSDVTTAPELPPGYVKAEEGHDDRTGSITGHVLDDEQLPLRGALVGFVDPYIAAVTNKEGFFEIGKLNPGRYNLYVIHMGYRADGVRVNVETGKSSNVLFILPVLPIEEPWVEKLIFEGRCERAIVVAGTGTNCATSGSRGTFDTSDFPTAIQGIAAGIEWTSSHWANSGLRLQLRVAGTTGSNHLLLNEGGPWSPVVGRADEERVQSIVDRKHDRCRGEACRLQWDVSAYSGSATSGTGAIGMIQDQRYNIHVTIFYRTEMPPDYDPVPPPS